MRSSLALLALLAVSTPAPTLAQGRGDFLNFETPQVILSGTRVHGREQCAGS